MIRDYFGSYNPSQPGTMGYNWRQTTAYHAPSQAFYGTHGTSGYLFSFDPAQRRISVLERLTSLPSKRLAMKDEFGYGYLGLALGPNDTIYYLTGAPILNAHGEREAPKPPPGQPIQVPKRIENIHLVTFHIPSGLYKDHGPIFFDDGQRPTWVQSMAVAADGQVYGIGRHNEGVDRADLFRVTQGDGHPLNPQLGLP
mmetsp:Transcript_37586/g.81470  ORF Transcript_37586/g.81470 Transcript_37586/m.81470 type:complete len:198 (+) Transcript_37586:658-1251(+)